MIGGAGPFELLIILAILFLFVGIPLVGLVVLLVVLSHNRAADRNNHGDN